MELKKLKLTARRMEFLDKLGIHSIEELLKTYPYRYEKLEAKPFSEWEEKDTVCFEGLICNQARVVRLGKNRSMTKFKVISWDEELEITMFNRPWLQQFPFGSTVSIFGVYNGNYKVTATNYNLKPIKEQLGIHPVYSVVEGLKQKEMQGMILKALEHANEITELVPDRYRQKYRLLDSATAYRYIHAPENEDQIKQAVRTLKYQEFLYFQCVMQSMQDKEIKVKEKKVFDFSKIEEWEKSLPYSLTADQLSTIDAICKDLASEKIMFRLVQGDVGCGKTMVAVAAMYACHLSKYQSAFLAPTEILARQHYLNMTKMGFPIQLYVSSMPAKEKKQILEDLKTGKISMVVGTHALFQEVVEFNKLGLVVVDEQQRFGVKQRRSLLEKGKNVDFLMMSATPIPRTYAHFLYGDMDISSIHTLPQGRKLVITKYIAGNSMGPILKSILKKIEEGRQCYVVCPAIEDNEELGLRSVTSIYEGMCKTLGERVKIALLHGKMSGEEKETIMSDFKDKKYDILVSTTVIEVGIDVANANQMVIYDSHRFGLSTLHQLRGRVARGSEQGSCYLLSSSKDKQAIERLQKLEELKDGFEISQYDLMSRGPGDILGVRQSGLPNFILGDLNKDQAMMEACIKDAKEILEDRVDLYLLESIQKSIETAQYFD
ncbi:MAG: ATP-dependent DNA helicase RecG [Firmicutes bacterium]|nr:ATP-dependent DNA helicase RecG [Bacillota bacterium]